MVKQNSQLQMASSVGSKLDYNLAQLKVLNSNVDPSCSLLEVQIIDHITVPDNRSIAVSAATDAPTETAPLSYPFCPIFSVPPSTFP